MGSSQHDLEKSLRSYTAAWVVQAAALFGTTKRVLNRALADNFGHVEGASLPVIYNRLAWVFTHIANGEVEDTIHGPLVVGTDISTDPVIFNEIRAFNKNAAAFLHEYYRVPISTVNSSMKKRFGPVHEADTGQLLLRAAALLGACAEQHDKAMNPQPRRGTAGRSEEWKEKHRRYVVMCREISASRGIPLAAVNKTMWALRGSIDNETESTLEERIAALVAYYADSTTTDPEDS